MARLYSSLLLSLVIAFSASAITMDWTTVGDPGNPADPDPNNHCGSTGVDPCGAVGYGYQIGTYEVTNAQYAEFLNAKAASDPYGLYSPNMGDLDEQYGSGITRSGLDGSYTYSVIAGREDLPVNYVSYFDTLRFANWLQNGQGIGDTETGAYTLLGGTPTPSNSATVSRNAGATIVLPDDDEWYKAAYYKAVSTSYFDFPAGIDAQIACASPNAASNQANCGIAAGDLTPVGSYTGSASPYGTFDQGGNVAEWNEGVLSDGYRVYRGGDWASHPDHARASVRFAIVPSAEADWIGFRVALVPEPGTGLLVIAGLLGLAGWRRMRA